MKPSPRPRGSSSSAGPRFLDRAAAVDGFRELARGLAARDPRVVRVVLFGSLATGRATVASDADLLIVLRDHPLRARERIPEYLDAFVRGPLGVDVFPFTELEVEQRRAEGDPFIRRIEAEGVDLLGTP